MLDLKAGRKKGRRTCFGGILDDIHLIQAFLNPLYKDLSQLGVDRKRRTEIYSLLDDILESLSSEFPTTNDNTNESESVVTQDPLENPEYDSDEELYRQQSQKLKGPNEREKWMSFKLDEASLLKFKYDSTPFWESRGKKLFPLLALRYYRTATKHASEALIERYFSIAGYVTSGCRASMGHKQMTATTIRHLWGS